MHTHVIYYPMTLFNLLMWNKQKIKESTIIYWRSLKKYLQFSTRLRSSLHHLHLSGSLVLAVGILLIYCSLCIFIKLISTYFMLPSYQIVTPPLLVRVCESLACFRILTSKKKNHPTLYIDLQMILLLST